MHLFKLFPCFQLRLEDNIYKLDYSNNVLFDGFPHVWQYERTLEELNITAARIKYLPPQLFYCHGLKVLLANNNNIENIPEVIGGLRLLQKLSLNRNFISKVPDNIKSCKSLTYLDLSYNTLQRLPDAITCLISLQELLLNETYLEFLPANFGRLVNLRILELRSNKLISLPKSMYRLNNLYRLDIGCNGFKVLPEVIEELKQLRELWFDFNQIYHFPVHLGKLRELVHCEANGNCFNKLSNGICEWRNLELLSMSFNCLNSFPYEIGMLMSLVTFKCESNKLTDLPDSISKLENLEELDVSHNKLARLPNTIGLLRKLRYLFADDNKLQKLPDEICSCSALSILSISRNNIFELPKNIGHLSHLKVLNIVQNNIISLPVALLSLVNLTSLWINNNQSKPLIPLQYSDISERSELTCFMLPQCQPIQITSLNNIENGKSITLKQTSLKEQSVATMLSKRRIYFAEQAIILHPTQQLQKPTISVPFTSNSNIYTSHLSYTTALPNAQPPCENLELIYAVPSKDLLMRSPTPYPKELRLMAKFIRGNENTYLNTYYNDRELTGRMISQRSNNNIGNEIKNVGVNDEGIYQIKSNNSEQKNIINNEDSVNSLNLVLQYNEVYRRKQKIDQSKLTGTSMNKVVSTQIPKTLPYFNGLNATSYFSFTNCDVYEKKNQFDNGADNSNRQIRKEFSLDKSKIQSLKSHVPRGHDMKKPNCKWLFGVHRNRRVFQVNICWENGNVVEVESSPSKEGIYVVSTVPDSSASKVLFPFDKLLEVEGTDFTSVSLEEAKQLLAIPRPVISIMLSR